MGHGIEMLIRFDSFHADIGDERLWRGADPVRLTRKAWSVLRVLLESPGQLVTKEQFAQRVWHGTYVGDDSLTKVVRELRRALGDDPRAPRFIATVHGRGYRFVARLQAAAGSASPPAEGGAELIGRAAELATLQGWLADACQGGRRAGFVTGEVGMGKSNLVAAFLDQARQQSGPPPLVAAGSCIDQYGQAEPFLPVVEALRRAVRASPSAAAIVRGAAQPWLAAACGLSPRSAADPDARSRAGVLRNLAEVVESVAGDTRLILVLEDLHWSDPSTLDVVNLLARRAEAPPFLLLCTLRETAARVAGHPAASLLRDLCRDERAAALALSPWAADDVACYLTRRLGSAPAPEAAPYLVRHTGGVPFFVRALVDELLPRGDLRQNGDGWGLPADECPAIPTGSLAALRPRLRRLSHRERRVLEAASVLGETFTAELIAAVLAAEAASGTGLEDIEAVCERLARRQDILRAGEDGMPYQFVHALYRQALYEGIGPARRRRIHRQTAELLAGERPADATDRAAEIARHFGSAGEHAAAARYHAEAAVALRACCAYREVAAHLGTALTHLRQCPASADRHLQELMLLQQHAAATVAATGFGDPAVFAACRRSLDLARSLEIPLAEFMARAALLFLHVMRAELEAAARLARELAAAAPHLPLPECSAVADSAEAVVRFARGDALGARRFLEASRGRLPRHTPGFAFDAAVWQLALLAMTCADLRDAEAARAALAEILALVADVPAAERANAHMLVAAVHAQLRDPTLVLEHTAAARAAADDDDAAVLLAWADQLRGWAFAALGNAAAARAAYADRGATWRAIGQRFGMPFLAMLRADAALCENDLVTAQAAIRAGLDHAQRTGEHRLDSELYRLRAECLRRAGDVDQALATLPRRPDAGPV